MRIVCKVIGGNQCLHLESELQKGFGFDTLATSVFAESLCHSINRQIDLSAQELRPLIGSDDEYNKNVSRIAKKIEKDRFGIINVDIYMERRKGKPIAFCKISVDDSDCDVKTANILPETARFIYKTVYLLKRMSPPKGMDILRTLEIIRNFDDPRAQTHELYVENGTVKEREKTKKN